MRLGAGGITNANDGDSVKISISLPEKIAFIIRPPSSQAVCVCVYMMLYSVWWCECGCACVRDSEFCWSDLSKDSLKCVLCNLGFLARDSKRVST